MRRSDVQPLQLAGGADPRRGPVAPARRVDELDRGIIEALQENGRESFRRIASLLGVVGIDIPWLSTASGGLAAAIILDAVIEMTSTKRRADPA